MNRRDALKTMVASVGVLPTAQADVPKYLVRWGKIEDNGVRYPLGWSVHAQKFEANSESITFTFRTEDHIVNGIKIAIEQGYRFHFKVECMGQNLPCDGGYRCATICDVGDDKMRLTFVRSEPAWGYFSPPNT